MFTFAILLISLFLFLCLLFLLSSLPSFLSTPFPFLPDRLSHIILFSLPLSLPTSLLSLPPSPLTHSTPSPQPLLDARDLLQALRDHQCHPSRDSASSYSVTIHPLRGPFLGRLELVKQVTQNGLQNIVELREELCVHSRILLKLG